MQRYLLLKGVLGERSADITEYFLARLDDIRMAPRQLKKLDSHGNPIVVYSALSDDEIQEFLDAIYRAGHDGPARLIARALTLTVPGPQTLFAIPLQLSLLAEDIPTLQQSVRHFLIEFDDLGADCDTDELYREAAAYLSELCRP